MPQTGSTLGANVTGTGRVLFHEQKKIEKLLLKLAIMKPISPKPAPMADGQACRHRAA